MSAHSVVEVTCPACSESGEFTIWESLNVDLDPGAKRQLLNGELTTFSCAGCGERTPVSYTLLYHDMTRRAMFWLFPGGETPDPAELERFADASSGALPGLNPFAGQEGYRYRLVGTHVELIEKIRLLDDGWDDRVFEIARLWVDTRIAKQLGAPASFRTFYGGQRDESGGRTLVFHLVTEDGQEGEFPMPWTGVLEPLCDGLAAWLDAREAGQPRWKVVDFEYASEQLQDWLRKP